MKFNKIIKIIFIIEILILLISNFIYVKPQIDFYISSWQYTWLDKKINNIILKECKLVNIDPNLIYSVIHFESGRYCKNNLKRMLIVRSFSGAIGIMQIMPVHAEMRNLTVYDLEKPEINIKIGISYFKEMIKIAEKRKYKNVLAEALRMYNQGPGHKQIERHRNSYRNWKYVCNILTRYQNSKTFI